jgi:geranylgeranyl diphosphate synthase type II
MIDFKASYKKKQALVDNFLNMELSEANLSQIDLLEIMRYAVLGGGKRIRPILLLSAFELFSSDLKKALPFSCSLEMIHTYSLIHDDLPAMDNDDFRRGNMTSHKKFSEFGAILAGDALLNLAFETMVKYAKSFDINISLDAIKTIAKASGANGMCGGQMTDMSKKISSFNDLKEMYHKKTGALINASVVAGGILGGANSLEITYLSEFADILGVIFQIKDDILDVTSDFETLGKPILSDEKNGKITFVSEYGIEKCIKMMEEYLENSISLLDKINGNTKFLKELSIYITNRNS